MAKKPSAVAQINRMERAELKKDLSMLKRRIATSSGAEKKKLIEEASKLAQRIDTLA